LLPLRSKIEEEARNQGVDPVALIREVAAPGLNRSARYEKARELMRQWVEEGDEAEQVETLTALKRILNENRSPDRAIFP
jgi:chromosome condensin MukBEF ATPase and DNA-binding subunit MukB